MKDKAVKNVVTMSLEMFVSCFLCHVTYSITLQQCNVAGNRLHITHYMWTHRQMWNEDWDLTLKNSVCEFDNWS
jgi:hypothetical protein